MSRFRYMALSAEGDTLHGCLDADSEAELIQHLQERGWFALEAEITGAATEAPRWRRLLQRDGIPARQILGLTQQLATLLSAGQPLDRALGVLIELQETRAVGALLQRLREHVRAGRPLSAALEAERGLFSRLYVSLVRAGEASGAMHECLHRLAEYLERTQTLRAGIVNALIYPAFLVAGVLASLVLLLAYVVPQFVPIFADMQVPIPWITRAILGLGEAIRAGWWLMALLLVAAVLGWRRQLRDPDRHLRWHARLLRLPALGALCLKLETARFSRSLGTLLHHGVPMLAALQVAAGVTSNLAVAAVLQQIGAEVRDGSGLSAAVRKARLFPVLAQHMMQVGEEAGQLDTLLLKVADTFDTEARRAIDRLLAGLVPALTVVMTGMVAVIMAAILLPLLSLTGHIQ
ncbi:type II secretion system F family protein [Frateuria aurantia]